MNLEENTHLKIYIALLLLNQKAKRPIDWKRLEVSGQLVDKKWLKSCRSEIQDGHGGHHLENLFCASPPEQKGRLTQNLVGSIGATCRSKIAKFVLIRNLRWPWRPSTRKSSLLFFS